MNKINARLYRADLREEPAFPASGVDGEFTLEELQGLVGGLIQIINLPDGRLMVMDEEGKLKGKPRNRTATKLAMEVLFEGDYIAGDAVIIRSDQIS